MSFSGTNMGRRLRRSLPAGPALPPLRDYALSAFVGLFALTALGPAVLPSLPASAWTVAAALYTAAALAVGDLLRRTYPHSTLGACNVVTLGRLVIVAALTAALAAGGGAPLAVFALAAVALALDGVDGWLARRGGHVSAFGARFDVEVDAAFALVLSLHALVSGTAGPLVLVLGVIRYVFAAATLVLPWLGGRLPERFSRKAVCVIQLAALILLQLPGLPGGVSTALVGLASAALFWSFGRDILHLRRHRAMTLPRLR
jgi:phosphatidylglycerophosphate synthase